MADRYAYILAMTGLGFAVLGVAVWRLHVLLEEAAGRIDRLELDLLALIKPKPGHSIVEDPSEWGC